MSPRNAGAVLQVLHEQQYLPRGASALPFAHRHIELVFDALRNPNNLEILREIIKAAAEHGGHVAVSTVPENMNARQWIHELERVGRAGVIMVTSRLTSEQQRRLQEAALPLVLIDPINSVDGPVPSVGATNWRGGVTAVQHLLNLAIGVLRCSAVTIAWWMTPAITATSLPSPKLGSPWIQASLSGPTFASSRQSRRPRTCCGCPIGLLECSHPTTSRPWGVIEAARRHGLRCPET